MFATRLAGEARPGPSAPSAPRHRALGRAGHRELGTARHWAGQGIGQGTEHWALPGIGHWALPGTGQGTGHWALPGTGQSRHGRGSLCTGAAVSRSPSPAGGSAGLRHSWGGKLRGPRAHFCLI